MMSDKPRADGASRSADERTGTAYHEAGHAVAGVLLDRTFHHVTIVPDDNRGSLGHVLYRRFSSRFRPDLSDTPATRNTIERVIVCAFAGPAAELHHRGEGGPFEDVGGENDAARAVDLATYACGSPEEVNAYLNWLHVRARDLITHGVRWLFVEAVAAALLDRGTLSYAEVRAVIAETGAREMAARQKQRCTAGPAPRSHV